MELKEELKNEIASVRKDVLHPYGGNLLQSTDETLLIKGGGRGLRLYDDLERDGHLRSVLSKRKLAVTAREWVVEAASSSAADRYVADLVRHQLNALDVDGIQEAMLDALLKGFSVSEVLWEQVDGEIVAIDVKPKAQDRFRWDLDMRLRLLTLENAYEGILVPDSKFVTWSWGAKDGNPYGVGMGCSLFWPVFFKRKGISFWLTFAEKFGSPTPIGKYPRGTTPEQQRLLLEALERVAQDSGVIIPEGLTIELLEATRSGSIATYDALVSYMDAEISKTVLGETLTTEVKNQGSYAAAQTHNEVRVQLSKADADRTCARLNRTLLSWITRFNVPDATPPRIWRQFPELADLTSQLERDKKLVDMGFRPNEDYVRRTYGDHWSGSTNFAESDAAVLVRDQLKSQAIGLTDRLIAPLKSAVSSASSLDSLKLDLPPQASEPLGDLLRDALLTAQLAGRLEVSNGE